MLKCIALEGTNFLIAPEKYYNTIPNNNNFSLLITSIKFNKIIKNLFQTAILTKIVVSTLSKIKSKRTIKWCLPFPGLLNQSKWRRRLSLIKRKALIPNQEDMQRWSKFHHGWILYPRIWKIFIVVQDLLVEQPF